MINLIVSPVYSGLSPIISLALVLLVLIIVGVFLLFLYKKHRSRGKTPLWLISTQRYESVQYSRIRYDTIQDQTP